MATTADGTSATAVTSIFVFQAAGSAEAGKPSLAGLGISGVLGNVDGQDGVDVLDALAIAQHVGGVRSLSLEGAMLADLTLDGKVIERDAELALRPANRRQTVSAAVLSEAAYPASVVTIAAPALLNADATVVVRVNGIASAAPLRAVLGYASFVVPANLPRTGTVLPVELVVDGVLAERFALQVPEPLPADPAAEVIRVIGDAKELLARQRRALLRELQAPGATGSEQTALLSTVDAGILQMEQAAAELRDLFAWRSGTSAPARPHSGRRASAKVSTADGDPLSRVLSAALAPEQVCDVLIPSTCTSHEPG